MQTTQKEIRPLTSLRFFAASLVFCEHLQMIPGLEWMNTRSGYPGKIGVSVFFVLSGFILTYAHIAQDWQRNFASNAREFYWSRFARIYPLAWLVFIVCLPLGLNSNTARVSVSDFPALLTLTDQFWPGFLVGPSPNKVAWTLSVEAVFYFFVPFVFLFLHRRKNALTLLGVAIPLYVAAISVCMIKFPQLNWNGYCRMPEFLLGIAGFYVVQKVSLTKAGNWFFIGGIACLCAAAIADNVYQIKFYYFAYAPGALLVILGGTSLSGKFAEFLSRPIMVLLGNASFALYLLHDPVLRYAKVLLNRSGVILPMPWNLLAGTLLFLATVLISVFCYQLYETPIRKKLRSFFDRKYKGDLQVGKRQTKSYSSQAP